MIPYLLMLVIMIMCIVAEDGCQEEKRRKRIFKIALIPLFILIAFKADTIGSDTQNYMRAFNMMESSSLTEVFLIYENFEPGYVYLTWILSKLSQEQQILLICLGLIVCVSLYRFINYTAKNRCLALFFFVTLGFFQFAMSGIRQTIAICIILWAYPYIRERKLIKFCIVILIAMQFHKSSVIFVPAYFISDLKLSTKNVIIMVAVMCVILFSADMLLLSVADVMDYNYGVEETGNGQIFLMIVLLITVLCYVNRNQLMRFNKNNRILINMNFISLSLWFVRLVSRTAERVSLYFMPYTYVALEEYISTQSRQNRNTLMAAAVILSSVLYIYRISGQSELNDFKFFFQ